MSVDEARALQTPIPDMTGDYVAAIDDSGHADALVNWDGAPNPTAFPFVGIAAILLRRDRLDEFEGRWNHLRERIQQQIGCKDLPPVHLRWMWGKNPPGGDKNPYVGSEFRHIRSWLRGAVDVLAAMQRERGVLGFRYDFRDRLEFSRRLSPYFSDPEFEQELMFLRRHNRGPLKGLYKRYHNLTTNPVLRILTTTLWSLDRTIRANGGGDLDVYVDRFAGALGIDAVGVLHASRSLAGLDRVRSLSTVPSYVTSPLCQAADFVAYTVNRVLLMENGRIPRDRPFDELVSYLVARVKTLDGDRFDKVTNPPPEAEISSLCIAYALARSAVAQKYPEFADRYLVPEDEFHSRAMNAVGTSVNGISVLTEAALTEIRASNP